MRAVFILAALTFSASASAGDVNAYRSGQTYATTPAPSPVICEMQCSGDAQCRSWNFLPPRGNGPIGQCELNATSGEAAAHPFAISGAAPGAQQSYDNRVVSAGTRTTRIGQPAAAPAPQMRGNRQVVRRPLPTQQRQRIAPMPNAAPQPGAQLTRAAAPRVQMPRPIVRPLARPIVRPGQIAPAPQSRASASVRSAPLMPTRQEKWPFIEHRQTTMSSASSNRTPNAQPEPPKTKLTPTFLS